MIDKIKIKCDIIKVLDTLEANGYIRGKMEIDFDIVTKTMYAKIHTFEKKEEKSIRITDVIV